VNGIEGELTVRENKKSFAHGVCLSSNSKKVTGCTEPICPSLIETSEALYEKSSATSMRDSSSGPDELMNES